MVYTGDVHKFMQKADLGSRSDESDPTDTESESGDEGVTSIGVNVSTNRPSTQGQGKILYLRRKRENSNYSLT